MVEFWESDRPILLPIICPNEECKHQFLCGLVVVEGQLKAEVCPKCGAEIAVSLSADQVEEEEPEGAPQGHAKITWYFDGAQASEHKIVYAPRNDITDLLYQVAASGCFYYVTEEFPPLGRVIALIRRLLELVPPPMRKQILTQGKGKIQPISGGNGGDEDDGEFLTSMVKTWQEK